MDDLISRQAAIDAICEEGVRLERNGMVAMCEIKQWCIDLLDRLPSAQPERKKGRWIEHEWAEIIEGNLVSNYECSQCHEWAKEKTDYCPNCGADMRGEEK